MIYKTRQQDNKTRVMDLMENAQNLARDYMNKHPNEWKILMGRDKSVPFVKETNPEVLKLMNNIDSFSGYIHSGASLAIVMRYLESLCT